MIRKVQHELACMGLGASSRGAEWVWRHRLQKKEKRKNFLAWERAVTGCGYVLDVAEKRASIWFGGLVNVAFAIGLVGEVGQ
jgi:hypothetical protein